MGTPDPRGTRESLSQLRMLGVTGEVVGGRQAVVEKADDELNENWDCLGRKE